MIPATRKPAIQTAIELYEMFTKSTDETETVTAAMVIASFIPRLCDEVDGQIADLEATIKYAAQMANDWHDRVRLAEDELADARDQIDTLHVKVAAAKAREDKLTASLDRLRDLLEANRHREPWDAAMRESL